MLFIYVYIAQCLLCFAVFSLHLWFGLVWLVVEEVKIIIRTILHICARITHTTQAAAADISVFGGTVGV